MLTRTSGFGRVGWHGGIADFVAAVRDGRPPRVDGLEATKVLRVIEALYTSAESGEWVALL